ncbi:MAG: Asp-tRNA(Asn)/Glu-tRNA(Gln) amidotransferase subunit GatC [Candidatus Nanopelagicales bacterium]|nr:Asp-tRNA(Asn)/Glu-tRNA(Gln) amidotransferase subunit GatC [Candidatus Nanopelagicales bacterium]MCF8550968.1 Asp-tRNA(Asn)/Glu-tRNA(Gln) amidotransferase subunit GatC [Candidatus Nanopelagicales bacterium]
MSTLDREQVMHLGRLARLELSEEEVVHYTEQLDQILGAIASISEVAAESIPPTSHPIPMTNVFRDDIPVAGLDRDEVAAGAPAWEDNRFLVPRILDDPA